MYVSKVSTSFPSLARPYLSMPPKPFTTSSALPSVHSSSTLEMKNKSQTNSLVLLPTSGYFWDDGGLATFCRKMIQKRNAVSPSQSSSGFQSLAIKFPRPVIARFEAVPSVNLALYHAKTFCFPTLLKQQT
ncbi:hypothetical protein TRIATDRAFT_300898 [Trichoderma atroviride IMI 206040]|uniref:Uncharacterized protein n=1 Tax=Hypocrea atroviridis (strain ATCC 20476 / IMI 206040) TaxID=452589 RepID=G9P3B3_HYPAI|nr:uncharacterized protein TRIATDRAFT_300898 [Trichoderma atroviride IMI 206040]EHK42874.1 hypothetical protein TRIATDRAFT_300898 [Trichoderma atroviride IMI 206040]